MMEFVSRLSRDLPLRRAWEVAGVGDATAFRWDRAILSKNLPPPQLNDLRILMIDEKAIRKHHGYVTLLMNGENGQLLHMNRNLAATYILKDALGKLWDYRHPKAAAKYLARWCGWAVVSGIEPVRKFGRSLMKAKEEVLNSCRHRITTGRPEGFDNTISRIVHPACGIRSLDYLFLKLRQESLPE